MIDREPLEALVNYCEDRKISLISDEIYHGIQYDMQPSTVLEFSDNCYIINSFSKYFSMTGWRIGWIVVPKEHVRIVERIQQNMFICASHASQILAIGAFEGKVELERNLMTYRENRKNLLNALPEFGFNNIAPPDGAFYLYIDISEFSSDSYDFAKRMLNIGGVAITPGIDFDPINGNSMIRLFRDFIKEEPQIWNDKLKKEIVEACKTIVTHEDAFIDLAFQMGPLEGLTANEIKQYIRFIGNRRLEQLGLDPIYDVKKNPLTWLDTMLNGVEHMNFFEGRATEYSKASTRGTWGEVFA